MGGGKKTAPKWRGPATANAYRPPAIATPFLLRRCCCPFFTIPLLLPRHGPACPGHLCPGGAAIVGPDKPGHDGMLTIRGRRSLLREGYCTQTLQLPLQRGHVTPVMGRRQMHFVHHDMPRQARNIPD